MTRPRLLAALAAALAAGGCSSPPSRFYTLDPVPGTAVPRIAGAPVELDAVKLPSELDRLEIVRRAGPNRLDVAELDRWAGPLDELVRRALAADLTARLPPGATVEPGAPALPKALRLVSVDIDRLEPDLAGHVVLEAHWALVSGDAAALRQASRIELDAATPTIADDVDAMSRALGRLADEIALTLASDR